MDAVEYVRDRANPNRPPPGVVAPRSVAGVPGWMDPGGECGEP